MQVPQFCHGVQVVTVFVFALSQSVRPVEKIMLPIILTNEIRCPTHTEFPITNHNAAKISVLPVLNASIAIYAEPPRADAAHQLPSTNPGSGKERVKKGERK